LPLARDPMGVLTLDLRGRHPDEHATVIALQIDGQLRTEDRFVPDADGSVTLPATAAKVTGPNLRIEPQGNLGYWNNTEARAVWSKVQVPAGGRFQLVLDYALAPGEEGGELKIAFGDAEITVPMGKPTHGWQDYRKEIVLTDPKQLGLGRYGQGADGSSHVHDLQPVTMSTKAGESATVDVVVRAAKLGKSALCNLRSLRLVPTEPEVSAANRKSLDRAAIERVTAQWCERLRAKNASEVAACYLNDAVLHRVGEAPITGRAAIEAYLAPVATRLVAIEVETQDVRGGGDVVVQIGREVRTLRRSDAAANAAVPLEVQRMDFVRTWHRTSDRDWQLQSDLSWPVQ
jgi:uncharacterized protein (TIGR02246 family)